MPSPDHRRLRWVMSNRTRRLRTRAAGELVGQAAVALTGPRSVSPAAIAEAMAGVIDRPTSAHCRVAGIRQGAVVIHVGSPTLVSFMQRRWQAKMLETLRRHEPQWGVRIVLFEYGCGGAPISADGVSSPRKNHDQGGI